MNKFDKAELEGRKLFKSLLESLHINDSQESKYLYDTLDYYYTNNKGLKIGVEIKKRSVLFEEYDTHFMEVSKYNAILQRIKDEEIVNAVYVNFFGEDSAYIYPVSTIYKGLKEGTIKINKQYCNKTTAVYQGKILKEVIEIPKELAWRYEFTNNKWIKL